MIKAKKNEDNSKKGKSWFLGMNMCVHTMRYACASHEYAYECYEYACTCMKHAHTYTPRSLNPETNSQNNKSSNLSCFKYEN